MDEHAFALFDDELMGALGLDKEDGSVGAILAWVKWAYEHADRKSTRLNSSHVCSSRMPSSA